MHTSMSPLLRALILVVAVPLAACASLVTPGPGGDAAPGSDASSVDTWVRDVPTPRPDSGPGFCVFADGRRCAVGQSCPAGDGCNTCQCLPGGGLTCTLRDCAPVACRTTADCDPSVGLVCVYHGAGCATGAVGACEPARECPIATPFCGCDGITHFGPCNGPDQPYVNLGQCFAVPPDAGAPVDCTPANAHCRSLPPVCTPGEVPQVIDGCWGPCVPFEACAPIPCDGPVLDCPQNTYCEPSLGRCDIGRL